MRSVRAALAAALALAPALPLAYDASVHRFGALAPDPLRPAMRPTALRLPGGRGAVAAPGLGVLALVPAPAARGWAAPDFSAGSAAADRAPGVGVARPGGGADVVAPEKARTRALSAARHLLGTRRRLDCSGFVLAAWRAAGIAPRLPPARSRTESLYRATRRVDAPLPGDLAFFHDTYDRNRDGRANDPFSHVALVEAVEGGRVTLLHRGARGVERIRMDLDRPSDPARNDPVRLRRRGQARARVLAGELFAGYGALPPARADVAAR